MNQFKIQNYMSFSRSSSSFLLCWCKISFLVRQASIDPWMNNIVILAELTTRWWRMLLHRL